MGETGGIGGEGAIGSGGTAGRRRPPWWSALLDLVLPAQCAGCGATGAGDVAKGLCPDCAAALAGPPRRARPSRPPAGLPPAHALAAYREPLPDIVIAQKEHGRLDLARPLGRQLARAVLAAHGAHEEREAHRADGADGADDAPGALRHESRSSLWLIPAPSTRRAVRRRGDDPVCTMARHAAAELRRLGLHAHVLSALRHGRAVADQAGLSTPERARNLAGALVVRPSARRLLPQRPAVLVDDVLTSGATLAEAARALRAAGGRPIGAAVLAATRLG